jgi:hypothetical protein
MYELNLENGVMADDAQVRLMFEEPKQRVQVLPFEAEVKRYAFAAVNASKLFPAQFDPMAYCEITKTTRVEVPLDYFVPSHGITISRSHPVGEDSALFNTLLLHQFPHTLHKFVAELSHLLFEW